MTWMTITGPLYVCTEMTCEWGANGDGDLALKAAREAHRHVEETGHRVSVERGQTRYIEPKG